MTKLYNREAYEVAHKILSETEVSYKLDIYRYGLNSSSFEPVRRTLSIWDTNGSIPAGLATLWSFVRGQR